MNDLALRRVQSPQQTVGILSVINAGQEGTRLSVWECWALELPWKGNRNRKSCIPPEPGENAVFTFERHESPRFGDTLWIKGVPGRSEILIHAGNYVSDTAGCILVGDTPKDLDGDGLIDVPRSQDTLDELIGRAGESGSLQVTWAKQTADPADLFLHGEKGQV
jgi:hypothetical protein